MKTIPLLIICLSASTTALFGQGPVDTAAHVAHGAVDTAANVTHSVVRGTRRAAHRIADVLTPESDATVVHVRVGDGWIDMPRRIDGGKTAFVVHGVGRHTHNFNVDGPAGDYEFARPVRPGQTKVLHVLLTPGRYVVRSSGHRAVSTTLIVR